MGFNEMEQKDKETAPSSPVEAAAGSPTETMDSPVEVKETPVDTEAEAAKEEMPVQEPGAAPELKPLSDIEGETVYEKADTLAAPKAPNELVTETLKVLKSFATSKPMDALNAGIEAKQPVFALLGGAYCLVFALVAAVLPAQLINSVMRYMSGGGSAYSFIVSEVLPTGTLFISGLLGGLVTIGLWVGCVKVIHVLCKQQVGFVKILNMVAVGLLPCTIGFAAAMLLSFLFISLSGVLIVTALAMSLIMIYVGMQKEAKFSVSPFWYYSVGVGLIILISNAVLGRIASRVLEETLTAIMSSVFRLF